jgi:PAS domain-containing protein
MTDIDYQTVFRAFPGATALLSCEFTILDANDEYLAAVGRESDAVLGQNIFSAFPKNLGDPADIGPQDLRASLESVIASRERDHMDLTRYDIEVPGRPGVFEERYWAVVNTPILDAAGEPQMIVHRVEDATATVRQVLAAQAVSG